MAMINPHAETLLSRFPPIMGPSVRQQWSLLTGGDVSPTDHHTLTFSPDFVAIYGRPTGHYSAFRRLMQVSVVPGLAPRWCQNFLIVANATDYLEFCNKVDEKAVKLATVVLDRRAMEGLWVQTLMEKYDGLRPEELTALISSGEVRTEEGALNYKQRLLRKSIRKILTTRGVEKYWAEKPVKYRLPDLDILAMDDDADEPSADLSMEFED